MGERILLKSWACFTALLTNLAAKTVPYVLYEVSEDDNYYQVMVVNDINFTVWVEKNTADATDYVNNYRTNAVVCHS